jgi:hypothetical protein
MEWGFSWGTGETICMPVEKCDALDCMQWLPTCQDIWRFLNLINAPFEESEELFGICSWRVQENGQKLDRRSHFRSSIMMGQQIVPKLDVERCFCNGRLKLWIAPLQNPSSIRSHILRKMHLWEKSESILGWYLWAQMLWFPKRVCCDSWEVLCGPKLRQELKSHCSSVWYWPVRQWVNLDHSKPGDTTGLLLWRLVAGNHESLHVYSEEVFCSIFRVICCLMIVSSRRFHFVEPVLLDMFFFNL